MSRRTMPRQQPGKSEQVVRTPREFLDAVERRFGVIGWDLAANADTNVCRLGYFGPDRSERERDSLMVPWDYLVDTFAWCNPPYSNIERWVEKASLSRGPRIAMLLPASVSSRWFARYVHGHAYVLALTPRLRFVGHTADYPRDLMLAVYAQGLTGFDVWEWKK